MDSDHRRRFVERGIPQHTMLYVVGQARERQDVVAAEIAADRRAPMFLISTRSQQQVSSAMKWGERGWAVAALLLTVGGVVAGTRPPAAAGSPNWALRGRGGGLPRPARWSGCGWSSTASWTSASGSARPGRWLTCNSSAARPDPQPGHRGAGGPRLRAPGADRAGACAANWGPRRPASPGRITPPSARRWPASPSAART